MAKKPSYGDYLIRGSKKQGIYFWLRRFSSLVLAVGLANWLALYIGTTGAAIAFVFLIVVIYLFISHYIAIALMAIENMLR